MKLFFFCDRVSLGRSGTHARLKFRARDKLTLCTRTLRPTPPRVWKSRDRHAPPRRVIQLYYAQGCFGPASAFSGASASNFRWMRRTASWSPRLRRRPARPFFFAAPKSSQRSSLERLRLRGASVARRHLAEREKSPASSVERPIGDGGVNARLFASGGRTVM